MTYFRDRNEAWEHMQQRNRAYARAVNYGACKDAAVLVDGPDDDYVVMTLNDAIEGGFLYEWAV